MQTDINHEDFIEGVDSWLVEFVLDDRLWNYDLTKLPAWVKQELVEDGWSFNDLKLDSCLVRRVKGKTVLKIECQARRLP